ncbi:MAG: hypothetical protein UZ17_ACD001002102 [Acidobacteria bacterium OLB17]|nr:MAG: hypothetical protein UZ17_ACD001002102 [Acidobacteria bacterium OLB17]
MSAESLRAVVGIAPRTLARRKHEKRLSPEESDRLVSVSRVLALAVELFDGDVERGMQWLRSPSRALKGRSPLSLAATTVGLREVEALIGRLEHGVIA